MRRFAAWTCLILFLVGYPLLVQVSLADELGGTQSAGIEGVVDAYRFDNNTTNYRSEGISQAPLNGGESVSAIGSALATTDASIAGIHTIVCTNYASVSVPVLFSASGATVVVTCVRGTFDGTTWETQSIENRTITANTVYTGVGAYWGTRTAKFDVEAAQLIKVLFADPSTGTVTPGKVTVY